MQPNQAFHSLQLKKNIHAATTRYLRSGFIANANIARPVLREPNKAAPRLGLKWSQKMEMSMFSLSGIGGLLLLALDIWAIISIVGSGASTGAKVIWVLLVVILPLVGFIIWLIAGPKAPARHA